MRFRTVLLILFSGIVTLYLIKAIFHVIQNASLHSCQIPFDGHDPLIYKYLCKVDNCVDNFFEDAKNEPFEKQWRKIPDALNWCATNAQMSVIKFTTKSELIMFKVKNMMEKKKRKFADACTAVVISFDNDTSLIEIDIKRILKTCVVNHIQFSSTKAQGIANTLKSFGSVIDLLVVGPSKGSSHLLFQQFLGDYYDYLPPICQVNFAHTLPRPREENGFVESMQRLRSEKKFLLMGASKDRTHMHLNLFFEDMHQEYCRQRYFRYFTYF